MPRDNFTLTTGAILKQEQCPLLRGRGILGGIQETLWERAIESQKLPRDGGESIFLPQDTYMSRKALWVGDRLSPSAGTAKSDAFPIRVPNPRPILDKDRAAIGQCFGNPNPYNLAKKYGSTPPICTAVRPPFVSPYFPGF